MTTNITLIYFILVVFVLHLLHVLIWPSPPVTENQDNILYYHVELKDNSLQSFLTDSPTFCL
jgi:hypothetical protein